MMRAIAVWAIIAAAQPAPPLGSGAAPGRWERAASLCWSRLEALKARPSDGPVPVNQLDRLLSAAEECGDWPTALETAETLATATGDPDVAARAAWLSVMAGRATEARDWAARALASDPANALALAASSWLAWDCASQDVAEASAYTDVAAAGAGGQVAAATRAYIELLHGSPTLARQTLQPVLEAPASPWVLFVAGAVAWRMNDARRAVGYWARLCERWPAHPLTRLARTGLVPVAAQRHGQRALLAAFSPDGTRAALQSSSDLLTVVETADFDTPIAEARVPLRIRAITWTRDGTGVLIAGYRPGTSRDAQLWRWDLREPPRSIKRLDSSRRSIILGCFTGTLVYLSYVRQGRRWVREVRVLGEDGNDRPLVAMGYRGFWPSMVAIAPDGSAMIFRARSGELALWTPTTPAPEVLFATDLPVMPAGLTAGGSAALLILRAQSQAFLLGTAMDGLPGTYVALLPGMMYRAALSPDGKVCAAYVRGGTLLIRLAGDDAGRLLGGG